MAKLSGNRQKHFLVSEQQNFIWLHYAWLKSMSTRGPGRGDTCHLTDFSGTWPDWRAYPITEKAKTAWQLQFSGGSYTTPLLFSRKFLQILHKIRVTVRSSKTWAIQPIPLWLHMSVNMSLVSYMHECHVVWLITCQSMEVNSYPCKMAEQTTVIWGQISPVAKSLPKR